MELHLDTPIQYLKGVGPYVGGLFEKRGIYTVKDLLEWYPRAYEDRRAARSISSLIPNETVSLLCSVVSVRSYQLGQSRRKIYDVRLKDSSGFINCKYFRVPYRGYFDKLQPGTVVRVVGKVTSYRGSTEFHHPDIAVHEPEADSPEDQLVALYTETEGLSPHRIRKTLEQALEGLRGKIPDALPDWVLKDNQLCSRELALRHLHFPPKEAGPEYSQFRSPAHLRLIFEEFFWLELYLAVKRSGMTREASLPVEVDSAQVQKAIGTLPFQLTGAQTRTLHDIFGDLKRPYPMHRLVQGDVGSGKTIVAFLTALGVIRAGYQVALMAPTEILAEQHYKNAQKILAPLGVRCALLSGQTKEKDRREILESLRNGSLDFCMGTHALIQGDVEFAKLALAVIDEQHRFGVHQRKELKQKGVSPHFLVMTATPIPRTLAMTVYGDLDVSIINERPAGRQPIVTRVAYESRRAQVYEFLKTQVVKGRQAYVVFPLVEESEKIDLKNAVDEYQTLQELMPEFQVGLLHGQMKADEKDAVMEAFRAGRIQILVSTTVIEVGVDVPNANIMVIEHAERFGLSQLHQLRGRVGRGSHKSYCVLCLGRAVSDESKHRAEIMASTDDGFKIAEADLEIRGPGEFLGSRQSGLPGFKMANLVRDSEILQRARNSAFALIEKDPDLVNPTHSRVRAELKGPKSSVSLVSVG